MVTIYLDKQVFSHLFNSREEKYSLLREKILSHKDEFIFFQLDEIVKPDDWNLWIPDLIRYWRMKRYSHISGKLFMRTDLFRSINGVNNINELANSAINIEWQKEELFSFFFQLALKGDNAKYLAKIMTA